MKKFIFILACLPLFLGIQVSGDFVFYPGILAPIIFIVLHGYVSIHTIVLLIIAVLLALFNRVNLISLFYYLFGLVYIFNRMKFRKEWVETTFNIITIICFITIVFDFLGFKFVDFLTTYERRLMIDDRSGLYFARPTGFFREPSALALLLGVIYSVGYLNNLKIRYNLLILSGILTFSVSFYLLLLFTFVFYSPARFKLIKSLTFLSIILMIFQNRINLIFTAFRGSQLSVVEMNLSVIKRYVQPGFAMYEFITNSSLYNKLFGYGPGGYKEYLMSRYSYIVGSDLRAGYLLNIFGNYLMGFGLIFAVVFLFILRKKYTFKEFALLLLLCFQGVAVVHPVFLLASLKIKD